MPPAENMRDYDGSHIFAATTAIEVQMRKREQDKARKEGGYVMEGTSGWVFLSKQQIIDCCEECRNPRRVNSLYLYMYSTGVVANTSYPYTSTLHTGPQECKDLQD